MALSWTQDRLGPICRYAEDTAIVMQAIAKPDGRDMSVSDVPFNWDARVDIRKLKVGIIKDSFDSITNASAKANAEKTLQTFRSIGVTQFIPIECRCSRWPPAASTPSAPPTSTSTRAPGG